MATMDRMLRFLVNQVGLSVHDAVQLCADDASNRTQLRKTSTVAKGAIADLVVMDRNLNVKQTYVADGWCPRR